jgi:hypothetical protein
MDAVLKLQANRKEPSGPKISSFALIASEKEKQNNFAAFVTKSGTQKIYRI